MVKVNWSPQAVNDIDQIAQFIAQDSVKFAQQQVVRFFEVTEILERLPKSGRIVPEFNKPNIRELILGNYRIVYLIISSKRLDVVAVHHSARLLKRSHLRRK